MNPTTIMTTFLGATALVSTATASAQELGHIASVAGRVIVQKANGSQVLAKARMPLYHGDRVMVMRKSLATVAYADTGCIERYDQNTHIKIVKGNGCTGSAVTVTKGPARTITKKLVTTHNLPTYVAPNVTTSSGSFAGVGTGWGILAAGLGIAGVVALVDDDDGCVSGC
ncbi:MAG: hypothetical protein WAQ53_17950 [Thiofilum sp.]|uniref:hypothetical protein n=1 Tax=Thiofilum sp. TaxID=2212733 RepID=UPI0025F463EA|nr:hypothetical protein [Thiofilum sp.]MBK8453639.1 hypothetical protein [Thiofilum sp.]